MRIVFMFLITFTTILFTVISGEAGYDKSRYNQFKDVLHYGIAKDRVNTIKAIVAKGDKRYYSLIKWVLENEASDTVLVEGINAIITLDIKEFLYLVARRVDNSSLDIRVASIRALGYFKDKTKEDIVISILKQGENLWLKKVSIWYLGQVKSQKSLKILYKIFYNEDTDNDTKIEIIKAIGKVNDLGSLSFLDDILSNKRFGRYVRSFSALAIADLGRGRAINILKRYTEEKDSVVFKAIIEAFGKTKDIKAYPYIFSALKHDDESIRYSALLGIEHLRATKAFDIINYMVNNEKDAKVRSKAVLVLSIIGGERVIKLWLSKLRSSDIGLKLAIIKSLDEMDKDIAFLIIKKVFLKEKDIELQKAMIQRLIKLNYKESDKFMDIVIMSGRGGANLLKLQVYYLYKLYSIRGTISIMKKYINHENPSVRRYIYYILINARVLDKQVILNALLNEKSKVLVMYVIGLFRENRVRGSIFILKDYIKKSKDKDIIITAKKVIEHLK